MVQIPLFSSRAPRVSDSDVAALILQLRGHGWQTAKVLTKYGWTDRKLRAVANASKGQVISGQLGYCRLREATIPEVQRAADWLRHQATSMLSRASEIEREMHRRTAAA